MGRDGLNQSDLARSLDTRQSTVSGWLKGAMPRRSTLTQIASVFNVSSRWLETGIPDSEPIAPFYKSEEQTSLRVAEPDSGADDIDFSNDEYRNLVIEFIDDLPPKMLIDMIDALAKRQRSGDRVAVERAGILLDLIHERRANVFDQEPTIQMPFYGEVAAGKPADMDPYSGDTREVPDLYGSKPHFLVRVRGRSMEPEFEDGSYVVVRPLQAGEYPKKGDVVIANDGSGPTMKKLEYRKAGPKGDVPRTPTPHLVSINPDFDEVIPLDGSTPIQGVVVDSYGAEVFEG